MFIKSRAAFNVKQRRDYVWEQKARDAAEEQRHAKMSALKGRTCGSEGSYPTCMG
jgi:hypothetical protein